MTDNKFNVRGDVGVAVNAEAGSVVHVHSDSSESQARRDLNQSVSKLLKLCDEAHSRKVIENIANHLYGSDRFVNLQKEQVDALFLVASEIHGIYELNNLQVLVDEIQFFNMTKMHTSAPERNALLVLMRQEVNSKEVAKARKTGVLKFSDGLLQVKIPPVAKYATIFLGVMWLFSAVAAIIGSLVNNNGTIWLAVLFVSIVSIVFGALINWIYEPHRLAMKLIPLVKTANKELRAKKMSARMNSKEHVH